MKRLALLVVVLVSLTACGSTSAPDAATDSTTNMAQPSTGSPPALWSKSKAGQEYEALVAPSNSALDALAKDANVASPSLGTLTRDCKRADQDVEELVRGLTAGAWPTAVVADINALRSSAALFNAQLMVCASATDDLSLNQSIQAIVAAAPDVSAKVELVRADLGLPAKGLAGSAS